MKIEQIRELYESEKTPKLASEVFEQNFASLKSSWIVLSKLVELVKEEDNFHFTECLGDFYSCESIFLESLEDSKKLVYCSVALNELTANISYLLARDSRTQELASQLSIVDRK